MIFLSKNSLVINGQCHINDITNHCISITIQQLEVHIYGENLQVKILSLHRFEVIGTITKVEYV